MFEGTKRYSSKRLIIIFAGILIIFILFLVFGPKGELEKETVSQAPEDQIKSAVSEILKGNNNLGEKKLRKVEVNKVPDSENEYVVMVEYNASDSVSKDMITGNIGLQMSQIYRTLFTGDYNIKTATVAAYFPMVDKYGNETNDMVYKTILDREEAAKVNWNLDNNRIDSEILPGVWTLAYIHPDLLN